jgi:hypothetical protein
VFDLASALYFPEVTRAFPATAVARFDAGRTRGGIVGRLQQAAAAVSGAINFVRLYFHPVKRHDLPAQIRVAPSW